MSTRAMAVVRAAYGVGLLVQPAAAARVLGSPAQGSHPVLRALGVRHLLAATALWLRPTPGVAAAAAAVDGAHVLSCLAWATLEPPDAGPALRDAGLETTLLIATLLTRRGAR